MVAYFSLCWLGGLRGITARIFCAAAIACTLVAINVSATASEAAVGLLWRLGIHWRLTPDPTDLVALTALLAIVAWEWRNTGAERTVEIRAFGRRAARFCLGAVGALACAASGGPPEADGNLFVVNQTGQAIIVEEARLPFEVPCGLELPEPFFYAREFTESQFTLVQDGEAFAIRGCGPIRVGIAQAPDDLFPLDWESEQRLGQTLRDQSMLLVARKGQRSLPQVITKDQLENRSRLVVVTEVAEPWELGKGIAASLYLPETAVRPGSQCENLEVPSFRHTSPYVRWLTAVAIEPLSGDCYDLTVEVPAEGSAAGVPAQQPTTWSDIELETALAEASPADAGTADNWLDSDAKDAGTTDAGITDARTTDAAATDAGTTDAGDLSEETAPIDFGDPTTITGLTHVMMCVPWGPPPIEPGQALAFGVQDYVQALDFVSSTVIKSLDDEYLPDAPGSEPPLRELVDFLDDEPDPDCPTPVVWRGRLWQPVIASFRGVELPPGRLTSIDAEDGIARKYWVTRSMRRLGRCSYDCLKVEGSGILEETR
jgi:hypothetical protein